MCKLGLTKIKLFIPAAAAAVLPPLGPVLGQYGVNTIQFCKDFNEATSGLTFFFDEELDDYTGVGFILVVDIFVYEDRTFKFNVKKPSTSFLLRFLTSVKVGNPQTSVALLPVNLLVQLAKFKFPHLPLHSACRMVAGTARSIGITITL